MPTFRSTFLFVAAAALLAASASAQPPDEEALVPIDHPSRRVAAALRANEPDWRVNHRVVNGSHVVENWRFRGEDVRISVLSLDSPEEAARVFAQRSLMISTGAPRVLKLGDEAHLWPGQDGGSATVHVRQGSVFVSITAPSEALARRFARHAIRELGGKTE